MKFCPRCQQDKAFEEFSVARRGKFGRAYYCRPCAAAAMRERTARKTQEQRAADAAWRAQYLRDNPEQARKDRERSRQWAKNNADSVNRRNAVWRAENPERSRGFTAAWRKANPEKSLAHVRKRQAMKVGAPVNDWSAADWHNVLEQFNYSCGYCLARGVPLQQEHMQPLSRGGNHSRDNIIPACAPCNMRKGTKTLIEVLM